ncbi:MAG: hypothetical protein UZ22_OP11002000510, partial [Microgenomates bacterium OLB23]
MLTCALARVRLTPHLPSEGELGLLPPDDTLVADPMARATPAVFVLAGAALPALADDRQDQRVALLRHTDTLAVNQP